MFYGTDPWATWPIHICWPISFDPLTRCLLWCVGPGDVREFRALLHQKPRTKLWRTAAVLHDQRPDRRRNGNSVDDTRLGDFTPRQPSQDSRTSSRWDRLRYWQTQIADFGWSCKVRCIYSSLTRHQKTYVTTKYCVIFKLNYNYCYCFYYCYLAPTRTKSTNRLIKKLM